MVCILFLTSSSHCLFFRPLGSIQRVSTSIYITVHSRFSSMARSKYLSIFSFSFIFTLWSAETARDGKVFFLVNKHEFWLWSSNPFVSQSPRKFYASFYLGQILVCAYSICQHGNILFSCTITSWSVFPSSRASSCIHFCQFSGFVYYAIECFISVTT